MFDMLFVFIDKWINPFFNTKYVSNCQRLLHTCKFKNHILIINILIHIYSLYAILDRDIVGEIILGEFIVSGSIIIFILDWMGKFTKEIPNNVQCTIYNDILL